MASLSSSEIFEAINDKYSQIAKSQLNNNQNQSSVNKVAAAFGYSSLDLEALPDGANMGLSCGNPVGVASINEGENVVDLGCGGGLDILLAAQKIGPTGRAIGLDMSDDMLTLARRNAEKAGYTPTQVAFQKAVLPDLPLETSSTDIVLSNCVLNLLPEDKKSQVWLEISRILKPGGRVAISDILAKKEMSPDIRNDVAQWTGCIAGASLVEDYRKYILTAGFESVELVPTGADLSVYTQVPGLHDSPVKNQVSSCCSTPQVTEEKASPLQASCCKPAVSEKSCCSSETSPKEGIPAYDVNEYAGSYLILAVKPY